MAAPRAETGAAGQDNIGRADLWRQRATDPSGDSDLTGTSCRQDAPDPKDGAICIAAWREQHDSCDDSRNPKQTDNEPGDDYRE
jgi:hypothetical protein